METEKITINIGAVDLGQIDLLVDQGFYSNRTDFIRTAIRNHITFHANDISGIKSSNPFGLDVIEDELNKVDKELKKLDDELSAANLIGHGFTGTGMFSLNTKDLEAVRLSGKKISIKMIGILIIDKNVPPELVEQTVQSVKVYGIIRASDEVKQVVNKLG
jgi:Arc/MetJ-type ribon-helix-helix transcriptional regulator